MFQLLLAYALDERRSYLAYLAAAQRLQDVSALLDGDIAVVQLHGGDIESIQREILTTDDQNNAIAQRNEFLAAVCDALTALPVEERVNFTSDANNIYPHHPCYREYVSIFNETTPAQDKWSQLDDITVNLLLNPSVQIWDVAGDDGLSAR